MLLSQTYILKEQYSLLLLDAPPSILFELDSDPGKAKLIACGTAVLLFGPASCHTRKSITVWFCLVQIRPRAIGIVG